MGINPNQPTQKITGAPPSADGSVVSELLMSAGAPRAGARVFSTPTTTDRRLPRVRPGEATGTRPRAELKCNVGTRVVVERKHLNLRIKPNEPARAVLGPHNQQNCQFYRHAKREVTYSTWNVEFVISPRDQAPLSTSCTIAHKEDVALGQHHFCLRLGARFRS